MKKGMLISFEGGEASGKTTQIKKFISYLKQKNFDIMPAKEPGGTLVGEAIRNILLHTNFDISSRTETLLFNASRSQLIEDVIKPALEVGKMVVLDRFFDSTYAYEGFAGKLSQNEIKPIIEFATEGIEPDLTFLLDIDYEKSMERKALDENLKNLDRIENKERDYHEKVRAGFLTLAKQSPNRFVVIDASGSIEEVFEKIKTEFEKKYKLLQK